ncbi:MAG: hypothetical protein SFY92_08070 [Verrucomicrobiae bacterium]|nr:hypothetical protein [Verrucomicrobiae bacterium]
MKKIQCLLVAAALTLVCTFPVSAQETPAFLKEVVTYNGPAPSKEELAMRDVYQLNQSMFGIYDTSLKIYQRNIRERVPLIMGLFSGKGGRFILYRPGKEPLEAPSVPVIYQLCKSTGHCAMGTYALVAPYIGTAKTNQSWVTPMKAYRMDVISAKASIPNLNIKPEEKELLIDTLTRIETFMDTCLKNGTFSYADLEAYARGVEPNIEKLVAVASSAQVKHWFGVLTEWKKLLGKDWDRTYALSNSIYVARQNNILFSVLVQFMGKDAINNRLIMLETTDFQTTPEAMMEAFARIVSDRVLGKVFFNNDRLMDYELLGFGGRAAIEAEMKKLGKEAVLPPLVPFNSTAWPWKTDPASGTGPKSFDDLHEMGLLKK